MHTPGIRPTCTEIPMKRLMLAVFLFSSLVANAASATPPVADDAVFVEGARYSAVLSVHDNAWRLLPSAGRELKLRVNAECRAGIAPPRGLWLLTRDALGRPELVAPSATRLPLGHDGRIRLVGCDQPIAAGENALALPSSLLAWLQQNSGSIYVAH